MPESASSLASIDYAIIAVYMVGMMVAGVLYSRFIQSSGDFFLAGRSLPFWAIGFSIVASDIGAIDLITGSGAAYKFGMAQANFDWIGSVPAVLLAAFLFVPYYWRSGVYTIPEFLGRRYNAGVQWIQAIIWLAFMTVNVAIMLYTAVTVLNAIFGWNTPTSLTVTVVLVGAYTITGGLAAVVMTDVMQIVVMFIGTGALVTLSLWEAGGWSGLQETIAAQQGTADFFKLLRPHDTESSYPWSGIVFGLGLVMSTAYFAGNQAVLQRALGARSEWDAKAGMIVAGALKLAIPLLMFVPGLAARALFPDLDKPDQAVPLLVKALMPAGLMGLMFAAFFAALMSSVDSYLNSCITMFVSDVYSKVYPRFTGRTVTDQHTLRLGRILTAGVLIGAALCAPLIGLFETIYVALQTTLSIFQGPTLAILMLGILWRRASGMGGLVGLVLGVLLAIVLNVLGSEVFPSDDPFLFVSFWSFVFTLVVTVAVSLATAPPSAERIRGLTFGSVLHDAESQQALRNHIEGT